MGIPPPPEIVAVRDVLDRLGFTEDPTSYTDEPPGLKYDFGNLLLRAGEFTDLYLQRNFDFSGLVHDSRTLREVAFSMPVMVESTDQVLAWIAYGVGLRFTPARPTPWFEDGKALQAALPWEQQQQRWRARPHCSVDRDWMRVAIKRIRPQAALADQADTYLVEFDGSMLKIKLPGELVAMPADGPGPWPAAFRGALADLARLPKRLNLPCLDVSLWQGQLQFARCRFAPFGKATDEG